MDNVFIMKNILPFLAAVILFAQCNSGTSGQGNVITEKRELPAFHALHSDAVSEITIVQDSIVSVEVKGYENLVPLLLTSVENGVLVITMKKHLHLVGSTHTEVIIHIPSLDEMEMDGVGSISSQGNFNFKDLTINLSGVGSIDLSGQAKKVIINDSGAGAVHCKNLLSDTTIATTSGVGSIRCNAIKYLNATVSGVGSISYTGDPVVEKTVSGVGSVNKE